MTTTALTVIKKIVPSTTGFHYPRISSPDRDYNWSLFAARNWPKCQKVPLDKPEEFNLLVNWRKVIKGGYSVTYSVAYKV